MPTFTYRVLFEPEQDGRVHAFAPELPGVHTYGATHEEALKQMEDAAVAYLEDMLAEGEEPPGRLEESPGRLDEAEITVTA
jgi:predicted RNase H-like HicB family nuclease